MYGYAASSASATSLTPFTPPQQNTNPGLDRPGGRGQPGDWHLGRQRTEHVSSKRFLGPQRAAEPHHGGRRAGAAGDPLGTLSDLISIFLDAPASVATFLADIPFGVIGVVALPLDIIGAGTGAHTDKIVSGWDGQRALAGRRASTGPAVPGAAAQPARQGRCRRRRHCRPGWAKPTRSGRCPCRRRGPSPPRR